MTRRNYKKKVEVSWNLTLIFFLFLFYIITFHAYTKKMYYSYKRISFLKEEKSFYCTRFWPTKIRIKLSLILPLKRYFSCTRNKISICTLLLFPLILTKKKLIYFLFSLFCDYLMFVLHFLFSLCENYF